MQYSQEFKEEMVKKMLLPGGPSALALAQEVGISQSALSRWKRKLGESVSKGTPKKKRRPQDWSPEERLEAIIETATMNEEDLGRYLRRQGLRSEDLTQWRNEALEAMSPKRRGRPKVDPELLKVRKQNKDLEKQLHRKDKALSEASARIILLKKAEILFGKGDEEGE